MANNLVEPPLEATASAIAAVADSSEESVGQIDGATNATHALVANGGLDSYTSLWV